jgi:hypothetical protein
MTIRKATVCSISQGTMRVADLLNSFGWELAYLSGAPSANVTTPIDEVTPQALAAEAQARAAAIEENPDCETDHDSDLLAALFDALNEFAPPYCYFGASEGDGSDYGFWPIMDAIEELPRIRNVEGEEIPNEDHCYANDHGNVTVYSASGEVILELV